MRENVLAFLAEHRATRVPHLTRHLVETIIAGSASYSSGVMVPRADLEQSCRDNIARVLELLEVAVAEGPPESHEAYYDAARETGARRASQGLPLDDVLRSFRLGGRLLWEDLVARSEDELDADALRRIGTRLWQVVDETSGQVAVAYHETERSVVRADEQRKAALWEGLLGGRATDPSFALQAARILDLPESGPVVMVATAGADLDPLERALGAAGLRSTWVRRATGGVALVTLGDGPIRGSAALLDEIVARLDEVVDESGSIGVSAPARGLASAHEAFDQASLALQARGGRPGVLAFDAVLPEALLLTAGDVTGRLLDQWLRPVLALPAAEHEPLLDTLEAWVATGGSAVATAEQVHCHRNTVVNRLRRVAELTGREEVTGTPVPVELVLALRARHLGGPTYS